MSPEGLVSPLGLDSAGQAPETLAIPGIQAAALPLNLPRRSPCVRHPIRAASSWRRFAPNYPMRIDTPRPVAERRGEARGAKRQASLLVVPAATFVARNNCRFDCEQPRNHHEIDFRDVPLPNHSAKCAKATMLGYFIRAPASPASAPSVVCAAFRPRLESLSEYVEYRSVA